MKDILVIGPGIAEIKNGFLSFRFLFGFLRGWLACEARAYPVRRLNFLHFVVIEIRACVDHWIPFRINPKQ